MLELVYKGFIAYKDVAYNKFVIVVWIFGNGVVFLPYFGCFSVGGEVFVFSVVIEDDEEIVFGLFLDVYGTVYNIVL